MKDLRGQARVTAFLRNALAEAPQEVLKLEAMARTEGLLGERQRITHAKPFKRSKHSLRIRSVRAGFGTNRGWRWELPCDRDGALEAQCFGRLHVDDEFEFGGLHHRQVSGLGALEEHALGSPKSYAAFTL